MSNISNNLVRTNFNIREISAEVNKIKKIIQNAVKIEERFIILTSAGKDSSKVHINIDKIECIEEYTLSEKDYFGTKSVVYMISSNFFHVIETPEQIKSMVKEL